MRKRLVISVILASVLLGMAIAGFVVSLGDFETSPDGFESGKITVITIDELLDAQKGGNYEYKVEDFPE